MAALKQSDRIRGIVADKYVSRAVFAGERQFSIRVRDVLKDAEATEGFPRGRTPLICEVLQGKKLLKEHGLEIERVDGPPSKQSATVVVHYRMSGREQNTSTKLLEGSDIALVAIDTKEDAGARAKRLTDKLRGLLKNELAEYGGAEAFMKWIRSDEEYPG